MIDVQRLRVLREVARHGSFNRAAAELRLTPSAVSQQIAALERSRSLLVLKDLKMRVVSVGQPRELLTTMVVAGYLAPRPAGVKPPGVPNDPAGGQPAGSPDGEPQED